MSSYLLGMLAATTFALQATPSPPAAPKKSTNSTITLTGCVSQDAATPNSYTFSDTATGAKYRLSGLANKRGEIVVGTGAKRVTIRGGLVPSPNVAAQAGAIDPAKAAIASMPGGSNQGTGSARLPEFRATRVQMINGSCP